MYIALGVAFLAMLLLYAYLLRKRLAIEASHHELEYLEQMVASR
jgi:hypothetical protein